MEIKIWFNVHLLSSKKQKHRTNTIQILQYGTNHLKCNGWKVQRPSLLVVYNKQSQLIFKYFSDKVIFQNYSKKLCKWESCCKVATLLCCSLQLVLLECFNGRYTGWLSYIICICKTFTIF